MVYREVIKVYPRPRERAERGTRRPIERARDSSRRPPARVALAVASVLVATDDMDAKRARHSRGASFASPPPGARRALAFASDDARPDARPSTTTTTDVDAADLARASLAWDGVAHARASTAFDTPTAKGARTTMDGGFGSGTSNASTETPTLKRKTRIGSDENANANVANVFATPFARALAEASVAETSVGILAADALEPTRRSRPMASPTPMKTMKTPPAPPKKLPLAPNMTYGYTPSRGDTRYDASQRVETDEPSTPAAAGPCAMIPSALDAALGLPMIDGGTLCSLLANRLASGSGAPEVCVIDCRFPYEYAGGHVRGAVNMYLPHRVQTFLTSVAAMSANIIFVFYCEFSSERAPRMWRHVRNLDRRDHVSSYPALAFPHAFVLAHGFSQFIEAHGEWCDGGLVKMSDVKFTNSCREYLAQSRHCWFLAQSAKSMRDVPSEDDLSPHRRAAPRGRGFERDDNDMEEDD